jgi:hypothetical protein
VREKTEKKSNGRARKEKIKNVFITNSRLLHKDTKYFPIIQTL